ncbi:MAG: ribonuclease G [Candidatus Berkelbacteria bacterium]
MDEKIKIEEVAPISGTPPGVPTADTVSGVNGPMPAELHGWNWGAFGLSWIWGIANNSYLALLCLIPYVNLVMIFVLGVKGNEWAWTHRKFESVAQFRAVQKSWAIWGIIFFVLTTTLQLLLLVILIIFLSRMS